MIEFIGKRRFLHEGWIVEAVGGGKIPERIAEATIHATVPGSVHTDLLSAGLIVDPYLGDHERLVAWIGSTNWRYSTTFEWVVGDQERVDLVFHGLDTVASVRLNGVTVLESFNMHRVYRIPVQDALLEGVNTLVIDFAAPVPYADRMSLELGYRPHVNFHPYNSIRKMACNFGWDWGPDVATVGIWRPVELHSWSTARVFNVRPITSVAGESGMLTVQADVESSGGAPLVLRATIDDRSVEVPVTGDSATLVIQLENIRRWWPHGFGEQALYEVVVEVLLGGRVVDRWNGRVGFRSVRLDTLPDEHGTSMTFVVNDVSIFVRGANWIPDDAFVHRVSRERYGQRISQAISANINLLRVWGGGIFESDDFYELCDELGVLVWQDFLFACAAYAEEEPMYSEVEAEARENIVRLMPHASLILWNGSNENLWGYYDWNWQGRLGDRTWGAGYYEKLLPALLAELDPLRPYTPSSPWSPGIEGHHPNDPAHGSMHIWDLWNQRDYEDYRSYAPRFVAEFGWQGPPTWSTITESISDDPLTPESPGMLVHQKAANGNDKLTDGLVRHLPLPDDIEDWHWAMSLNQATAVAVGIEHLRSLSPLCSGSIVWQLNDCWPVTSWAAIDGYGRAKPLLYAIAHSYADRLVTIQPREDGLVVVLVNDHPNDWSGELRLARFDFSGSELASMSVFVDLGSRQTETISIPLDVATCREPERETIVATVGHLRGMWFFAQYRDSQLGEPQLTTRAERTPTGYRVSVEAGSVVRDLAILVDKVDPNAVVDDMLVTLLPGEKAVFHIVSDALFDPNELLSPRVLRSANQLVMATHLRVEAPNV